MPLQIVRTTYKWSVRGGENWMKIWLYLKPSA